MTQQNAYGYSHKIIYSIPVAQTTLTQFRVELSTVNGKNYNYFVFKDGETTYEYPENIAMRWLNQDEEEAKSGDKSDGSWDVEKYGVFDNPECPLEDINENLQRYHGEGVRIVGECIEVNRLDYDFIPEGGDTDQYKSLAEWAEENGIDLKILEEEEKETTEQETTVEPEKTPLKTLGQRTADEHEAAFGKMMEAMVAMDPNEVQIALTELNACRERAKEICGLTEEWRVKVEAEMKRQWEERQG